MPPPAGRTRSRLLCGLHVGKKRVEGVKADVLAQHDVFLFLVGVRRFP